MNLGEKMFPGSIVALVLGILLAAPLLYTNVAVEPVAADSEQLLDIDVTYAYIEKITGTYVPYGGFLPDSENPNATEPGIPRVNYFLAYNSTRVSEDIDPCDAKCLIYRIKFQSDTGFVGNLGMYQGIIYNSDLVYQPRIENGTDNGNSTESLLTPTTEPVFYSLFDLKMLFDDGFFGDCHHIGGGVGGSQGTGNLGKTTCHGMSGVSDSWGSAFGEPETMSLQISLLGWITLTGNSTNTVVLEEPEIVTEVQLEKFGDGFLYNTLIPEEELSEFDPDFNPLLPSQKLFELMGDLD